MNRTTQAGIHSQAEYGPTEEAGFLFQAADWPQHLHHPDAAFMNPMPVARNVSGQVLGADGKTLSSQWTSGWPLWE